MAHACWLTTASSHHTTQTHADVNKSRPRCNDEVLNSTSLDNTSLSCTELIQAGQVMTLFSILHGVCVSQMRRLRTVVNSQTLQPHCKSHKRSIKSDCIKSTTLLSAMNSGDERVSPNWLCWLTSSAPGALAWSWASKRNARCNMQYRIDANITLAEAELSELARQWWQSFTAAVYPSL